MEDQDFPKIISVDDHVIEPPDVWQDRLPAKYKDIGPRVERHPMGEMTFVGGKFSHKPGSDGMPCDWWHYEDLLVPQTRLSAAVGFDRDDVKITAITYEEMRKGCWDQQGPPRGHGRQLDRGPDVLPELSPVLWPDLHRGQGPRPRAAVRARPTTTGWSTSGAAAPTAASSRSSSSRCGTPQLAAEEIRRNAARGVTATCFSEIPPYLGLPSIHSGEWDPFFEACAETGVVVNMHIGSSSKMPSTSADAPPAVGSTLTFNNAMSSMVDFLMSGVLVRYPKLKLAYSEGQIGWIPYILERADKVWEDNRGWNGVYGKIPEPPSTYYYRQIYGCFFDDVHGLSDGALEKVGVDRICFETDYPHSDSTWPHSKEVGHEADGPPAR